MNNWKKNPNLVKHPRSTQHNQNIQRRSDPGNRVESNQQNNIKFNLPEKRTEVTSDESNYWTRTTTNAPENAGTPIYHDNGTVNVGYDKYITSELYSELNVLQESSTSSYGNAISCSQDGSTMAVADLGSGKIYIYSWNNDSNSWSQDDSTLNYPSSSTQQFTKVGTSGSNSSFQIPTSQQNSQYGFSLSLSSDGNGLLVGAPGVEVNTSTRGTANSGTGAVFYWSKSSGTWRLSTKLYLPSKTNQTDFGFSVYLHDINLFYAIGSPNLNGAQEGSVEYFYNNSGETNLNYVAYPTSSAGGSSLDAFVNAETNSVKQFILAIGIPYGDYTIGNTTYNNVGKINVITYNTTSGGSITNNDIELPGNPDSQTEQQYMGWSVSVSKIIDQNNKIYIIGGEPGFKNSDDMVIGQAYVYSIDTNTTSNLIMDDTKYPIENPDSTVVGRFGSSVAVNCDINTNAISFCVSNTSTEDIATLNRVYNFVQESGGSVSNNTLQWSGIPYNKEQFGYGYSLAFSTLSDLAIAYPSKVNDLQGTGLVQIYNNRIQLSLYVRGPALMDGNGFGKLSFKNDFINLNVGNIPSSQNSIIMVDSVNSNSVANLMLKSNNVTKSNETIYSENVMQSYNDANGNQQNLKLGTVGTTTSQDGYKQKSYLAYDNSEFNIYNYKDSDGFVWMDGYSDPVKINNGQNSSGTFETTSPFITLNGKEMNLKGNLNVTGSITGTSELVVVSGQHITYDNSHNDVSTLIINQYVDNDVAADNVDLLVVNKSSDEANLSNPVPLFSVNPYGVVSTVSVSDFTIEPSDNEDSPNIKYMKIMEVNSIAGTSLYGNVQIQGSIRNLLGTSRPTYTLKCIPALDENGDTLTDVSNNELYQWIYDVEDSDTTDGFVDINIKIKISDASTPVVRDIDMSGFFAGENLTPSDKTTGTDIIVVQNSDDNNPRIAVYMRLGENTSPNLTIKYSGLTNLFNFDGEPISTNPYSDSDWIVKASLSGTGIPYLNNDLSNTITSTFGLTEKTTSAGSTMVPAKTDAEQNVTPTVKNHITYNINGSTGLGIIPNTQLPLDNQIFTKDDLQDYINNGIQNLSFPSDPYTQWCYPLIKTDAQDGTVSYLATPHGPNMSPYKLDVSGNALIRGILGTKTAYTLSDKSVKDNIETIPNALEMVNNMRGVYYDHKKLNNKRCAGVIAQELETILPEAVTTMENLKNVSYNDIVGVLIESIKELSNEVKDLKAKINKNED